MKIKAKGQVLRHSVRALPLPGVGTAMPMDLPPSPRNTLEAYRQLRGPQETGVGPTVGWMVNLGKIDGEQTAWHLVLRS
jgi:hypothetical protein